MLNWFVLIYNANKKDLIRALTKQITGVLVLRCIYNCIKLRFQMKTCFIQKKAF